MCCNNGIFGCNQVTFDVIEMLGMITSVMKKFSKFLANFLTVFFLQIYQSFASNIVIQRIQTSFIEFLKFKKLKQVKLILELCCYFNILTAFAGK